MRQHLHAAAKTNVEIISRALCIVSSIRNIKWRMGKVHQMTLFCSTATSHENHVSSNHRQLRCFFKQHSKVIIKENIHLPHFGPMLWESGGFSSHNVANVENVFKVIKQNKITRTSTVSLTLCSSYQQTKNNKNKTPHHWPSKREIRQWPVDFPKKESVMLDTFQSHDVIIE